jgi:hypothetical protein
MGYHKVHEYMTIGMSWTYILNDFADLKALIPLDKRQIEFKVKLSDYTKQHKTSD